MPAVRVLKGVVREETGEQRTLSNDGFCPGIVSQVEEVDFEIVNGGFVKRPGRLKTGFVDRLILQRLDWCEPVHFAKGVQAAVHDLGGDVKGAG